MPLNDDFLELISLMNVKLGFTSFTDSVVASQARRSHDQEVVKTDVIKTYLIWQEGKRAVPRPDSRHPLCNILPLVNLLSIAPSAQRSALMDRIQISSRNSIDFVLHLSNLYIYSGSQPPRGAPRGLFRADTAPVASYSLRLRILAHS